MVTVFGSGNSRSAWGRWAAGALALVLAATAVTATACASSPQPTPELSPTISLDELDGRITLPTTVGLAFQHPKPANRIEHQILYTVQQSLRAQLHADYGPGSADPLLPAYWNGNALSHVRHDVAGWSKAGEQPVGVLVVTNTTYTPPDAAGQATVSYCASWQHVVRGNAKTHVVGKPVQTPGTPGTYTTLTLARGADNRWTMTSVAEAPQSPKCRAVTPTKT